MLVVSDAIDLAYVDSVEQSICLHSKLDSLCPQLVHHSPTFFSLNNGLRYVYSVEVYTYTTPLYSDYTFSPIQLTSKSLGQNLRHLRVCRRIGMVITTNV